MCIFVLDMNEIQILDFKLMVACLLIGLLTGAVITALCFISELEK